MIRGPGYRRWKNRLAMGALGMALALCMVPLISLMVTLVAKGGGVLSFGFLLKRWAPIGESGGMAHAILGSLWLLLIATAVSVPIGLAKGMYLSRRAHTPLAQITRLLLDVMTGIPAIIVGVFIYTIVVRPLTGFSMLSGGLALAMIMLPIFTRTTEQALHSIPQTVHEAGLALGLPERQVMLRIVLRAAVPAVLTGLFLSLARVAGEAAPLLF